MTFEVTTPYHATATLDMPLSDVLDMLANMAGTFPGPLVVREAGGERRQVATVHPDGGIDFAPAAREYR